jgi:hypothetical protein
MLGRPLPGPGERLFTDQDTEELLALTAIEAVACGGCGHPLPDTTDKETEGAWLPRSFTCHACAAREAAERAATENRDQPVAPGRKFYVERDRG